jgi:hypothetical protein
MSATVSSYPARLEGHLDPSISPWKWLIKWILVMPGAGLTRVLIEPWAHAGNGEGAVVAPNRRAIVKC